MQPKNRELGFLWAEFVCESYRPPASRYLESEDKENVRKHDATASGAAAPLVSASAAAAAVAAAVAVAAVACGERSGLCFS